MNATYHIGFAAICILGLISVALCPDTEMTLCQCAENSMLCVMRQSETQQVCMGDSVYSNMTLRVPPNVSHGNVTISVQDYQFSKGASVSGLFHSGDNQLNRWRNKISFEGNTMMYEVWNTKVQSKDEFDCVLEMNINGERFISLPFKWFDVDGRCTSTPMKPPSTEDILMQINAQLENITERQESMDANINALASDMAEVKKMKLELQSSMKDTADNITNTIHGLIDLHYQSLKTMLDYLTDIETANIIVSPLLHFLATMVIIFFIWFMFAYRRGSERSTSSRDMELLESGNTQETTETLLSPQDETAETDNL